MVDTVRETKPSGETPGIPTRGEDRPAVTILFMILPGRQVNGGGPSDKSLKMVGVLALKLLVAAAFAGLMSCCRIFTSSVLISCDAVSTLLFTVVIQASATLPDS